MLDSFQVMCSIIVKLFPKNSLVLLELTDINLN